MRWQLLERAPLSLTKIGMQHDPNLSLMVWAARSHLKLLIAVCKAERTKSYPELYQMVQFERSRSLWGCDAFLT